MNSTSAQAGKRNNNKTKPKRAKKGAQVAQAYEGLKKKIISLELRPGQYLDETKLARELAVGRTPLREAILRLKGDYLVVGEPNKSSYVTDLTLKGVRDLLESLMFVERCANHLAAQRASKTQLRRIEQELGELDEAMRAQSPWAILAHNFEFHRLISEASDNELIYQIHANLRTQSERLSYLALSRPTEGLDMQEYYGRLSRQHKELVACLENKDSIQIQQVTVDHIKTFRDRIMDYLNPFTGPSLVSD